MGLLFLNETYNGAASLSSNVGSWVDGSVKFSHRVDYNSNTISKSINLVVSGSDTYFELLDGSLWSDYGFADGKILSIEKFFLGGTTPIANTVSYLDGNKMFLGSSFPSPVGQYPIIDNSTGDILHSYNFIQTNLPDSLNFDFNLSDINSPNLNSLIDGGINRFTGFIGSLGLLGTVNMVQTNDKSGGLLDSASITYDSITNNYRTYTIDYTFLNWAYIQNGDNIPSWFVGTDTIGAINRVRIFSEFNNPNSVLEDVTNNTNGNCGGFNENFNTGNEPFVLDDIDFTNAALDVVDGVDYCNLTKFTATITADSGILDVTDSRFSIGMSWIPTDEDEYQNKLTSLGVNLGVNAPMHQFSHSVVPSPTQYNGYINPNFRWSFQNLQFTISGNTLTVTGDIFPTVDNTYFDTLSIGEKKHTLWIDIFDPTKPVNTRLSTSLKLYDEDVICSPELGSEISVTELMFDHDNNQIGTTTTEDDVLIQTTFSINKDEVYQDLKVGFQMYNTVTEESFNLEQFTFNFDNVPFIGGIYQINENIPRNFNLPPTTDRNTLEVKRFGAIDTPTTYGILVDYGWLNDWRYWLSKSNVNTDFFDLNEPHNGSNKDWQKYTQLANWVFRYEILVKKDDISDFHYTEIPIRPYEDEDVTTTLTFVDLINNTVPLTPIANTEIEVTVLKVWNTNTFDPATIWAEVTIEDFEGGNRWVLSSVLAQGNISNNPLKSVIVSDKLDVQIFNNEATLKYKIDTNIIDATNISLSSRVYSIVGPPPWIDLRLDGDVFTIGETGGNDVRHDKDSVLTRTSNGLVCNYTSESIWGGWVKFEMLNFENTDNETVYYIFSVFDNTGDDFMLGIGSETTNELISQLGQLESSIHKDEDSKFIDISGNNGTLGVEATQPFDATVQVTGTYKLKITNSGSVGAVFSIYKLPNALETSWNDESVLVHSEVSVLTPDEINIMPMCIINLGSITLIAIKTE